MKKNKKYAIFAVLVLIITLTLAGCTEKKPAADSEDLTLEAIVERLTDKVDVPPYETVRLDQTNFEYFTFVPYADGLSAVAADALVNVTPHSVVVIRVEDGSGADLAKQVVANADPNKWLCVGAETVNVAYTDHFVVLIMSETATADAIAKNFTQLSEKLDGMEAGLLTAGNSRYDGQG